MMRQRGEQRGGGAGRRGCTPAAEGLEGRIVLSSSLRHPNLPDVSVRLNIVGTGGLSGTATGADGSPQTVSLSTAAQAADSFDTLYARTRGDSPRWEAEAGLTNTYLPGQTIFTYDTTVSTLSGAHSGTLHLTAEGGTVNGDGGGTGEFITFRISPYKVPPALRRFFSRYVDLKRVSVTVKAHYGTGATEDVSTSNQIAFASVSYRGANTQLVEHSGSLVPNLTESRTEQFDAKVGGTFQVRIENYLDTVLDAPPAPAPDEGGFAGSNIELSIDVAPIFRGHASPGRGGR
jgi:hypothetical protein